MPGLPLLPGLPTPALGLHLPQGPLFPGEKGQLLIQSEAFLFSLLLAEPVCTPLECGARLCLSSLSPDSEPPFLQLTLPG